MDVRRIFLLFLVVIVISLFFGCAGGPEETGGRTSAEAVGTSGGDDVSPAEEPVREEAIADAAPSEPASSSPSVPETDFDARPPKDKGDSEKSAEGLLRSTEAPGGEDDLAWMGVEEESPAPGYPAERHEASGGYDSGGTGPSASGLKAGFADDNKQYGYFVRFLEEYGSRVNHLTLPVGERIHLSVEDRQGKSLAGARIIISAPGFREEGITMADGSYQFYPPAGGAGSFAVSVIPGDAYPGVREEVILDREGRRTVPIPLAVDRIPPDPIPLDLVFVMDTTGSMGEEIQRLKNTIEIIHLNLSALSPRAQVRFGMVLYRDVEDDYRTELIPLTPDLVQFQASLNEVEAGGGGDTPEDLQAALEVLLHRMSWNPEGIRLAYIITDAPPTWITVRILPIPMRRWRPRGGGSSSSA